ncbi:MAG: hypothetical protein WCA13_06410 [Terriglobales bacterium]
MKTLLVGIFAGIVLCGSSLAQDITQPQIRSTAQGQQSPATTPSAQSSSEQASGAPRIAPGSVIPVQLTKGIDAKKVKTGDAVEAKVTQDLKTGNGELVVPKDTKVVGHVTEVQVRTREQKESQVGIAFDHAVIKNGGDVTLPMSIQAIIAPPTLNPDNNNQGGGSAGRQSSPLSTERSVTRQQQRTDPGDRSRNRATGTLSFADPAVTTAPVIVIGFVGRFVRHDLESRLGAMAAQGTRFARR